MGFSSKTIKTIRIGLVVFVAIIFIASLAGNKKNKNIRIIKESEIAYLKDPSESASWGDISSSMNGEYVSQQSAEKILKMKAGETIGIVTKVGTFEREYIRGKRTFFIEDFRTQIDIPFSFYRPNCTTNPNRIGTLSITYLGKDNIDIEKSMKLQGKICLVSGRIEKINLKIASHACDETYATIYLENIKLEEYKPSK